MRKSLSAVLALGALALVGTAPAHATAKWACTGPAVACGSSGASVATKKTYKAAATKSYKAKTAYKAKAYKRYAGKKAGKVARSSYSGGSSGIASYYWQPQRVASGGWFNPNALTAAHKTLPFGTRVRVTNRNNGRSVVVTINDRGPYIKGRVIDLSRRAAQVVGMTGSGVAPVSYTVLGRG